MSAETSTEKRTERKQMSKRRQQVGGLAALALGLGVLAWVPSAMADPTESVLAEPVALEGYGIAVSADEVVVGDTVTVTVTAEDVTDLYAYDLRLAYDADLLDYVDGSADTDLTGSTYGLEDDGQLEVVHTKLGTSPSATGAVTLAEVTLTAVGIGPVTVSAATLETVTTDRASATTTGVGAVPVEVVAKAAPVATTAPTVSGTAKVGRTLTASGGAWDVEGVALSYQWLRGGTPVAGATGPSYDLGPVDAGTKVDVVVSAAKADHVTGTATATAGTVAKATTTTRASIVGKAKAGKKATLKVVVSAVGIDPTGAVKVTYAGKTIKPRLVLAGGKATLKLPAKRAGSYQVKVTYLAATGFTASSRTAKVRVR